MDALNGRRMLSDESGTLSSAAELCRSSRSCNIFAEISMQERVGRNCSVLSSAIFRTIFCTIVCNTCVVRCENVHILKVRKIDNISR